jgi:2-polyprenyl-6-methoxyphenol hydroxylase-like FAD-dependent oxidoreductase
MKPNLGQGAAQALVDAVVLGECLRGASDGAAALREYERRRIPKANAVVKASRQAGGPPELRNPLAVRLRDAAFRALPTSVAIAQQRRLLSA